MIKRIKKYSSLIAQHFNTKKHKKLCLDVENETFKNDFGNSKDLQEAFNNKCKENRELKKLNYNYKDEITQLKNSNFALQKINLEYQEKSLIINKKSTNSINLIDL